MSEIITAQEREAFQEMFQRPMSDDPTIASYEKNLLEMQQDFDRSAKEVLQLLVDISLWTAFSQESFDWLIKEHWNAHVGQYPFETRNPYKYDEKTAGWVMTHPFDLSFKMRLIKFFNLLETGSLDAPIATKDVLELEQQRCQKYKNLDRRAALLAVGAIDEKGNIQEKALARVREQYAKLKNQNMLSENNMEKLEAFNTDTSLRDGLDNFPPEFEKYSKLAHLYDRAHTHAASQKPLSFLDTGLAGIKASAPKQILKKYDFLLKLDKFKAQSWILSHVSEQDFFHILEVSLSLASENVLQELNTLFEPIEWYPEVVGAKLASVKGYPDYMQRLRELPFFTDFQSHLSKDNWLKTFLYTQILPNSLQDDVSMKYLWLSKQERDYIFDLRHEKTPQDFAMLQNEWTKQQETLKSIDIRRVPIESVRTLRKRQYELELILIYLIGMKDAETQQQKLQQAYSASFMSQRMTHSDFTRIGMLASFYGAIHHQAVPNIGYIPHYSLDYYPEFILPVLQILRRCHEEI